MENHLMVKHNQHHGLCLLKKKSTHEGQSSIAKGQCGGVFLAIKDGTFWLED